MKRQFMVASGLIALCGAFASTASAGVLFWDDFSAAGSGTGFSDNWSLGTINGGQITVTGQQSFRTLTTPIDCTTADFWFNAQIQITGSSSSWAGVSFYDGTQEDMFIGSDSASTTWEFDTDGTPDTNTSVPNYTGVMTQVIVHVTTTSIDMWIDPANTSSIAALGAADASFVGSPLIYPSWSRLRIASGSPTIVVDEMIAATTFQEAVGGGPGSQFCPGDGIAPHTPCPCVNNNSGGLGGCDWGNLAFPEGGVLDATGSNSMAANDAYLVATGVEDNFGIFFGANNQVNGGNGNPLNDGLRCAGGGLVRLIPPTMASGNQFTLPGPVQTLDTGAAAGATRRYQYWFRTPTGPCGQMANLTNGYEIVWLP